MPVYCPECDARVRVAHDDDRPVRCGECGEKFRPSEVEEDDPPARKSSRGQSGGRKENKSKALIIVGVVCGMGVVLVGGVCAILIVLLGGGSNEAKATTDKSPPTVAKPTTPARTSPTFPKGFVPYEPDPEPEPPVGPRPDNPAGNPFSPTTGGRPPMPPPPPPTGPGPTTPPKGFNPLDELFAMPVDKPPPTTKVGVLTKKAEDAPLTVPTFHSLMVANKLVKPSAQTKLTLDEVKAATVYVKVEAGDLSGTGSGFYIGSENGAALVATNHHVIEAATLKVPANGKKPKITCVFNSGVPADERPTPAKVVAFDPVADIAVLRLDNPPAKMPKPINPWATPKLTETMEVRICGFPFGEQLATATTNPNISVNTGTVSSLRLNKTGGLDKVQINGAINPGNSGGPIVDKDGRLVGVAVSTITGSGLGFAVPVDDLIAVLEGKILFTEFVPTGIDKGAARFKVVVPVMDPRAKVSTVYVRYWAGTGAVKPRAIKDGQLGYKPIEGGADLALKLPDLGSSLTVAVGELKLPADATSVVLQLGSEQVAGPGQPRGLLSVSAPVEYTLSQKELPNGTDAKPLADTFKDPAALAGQTVVVRGKVLQAPTGADPVEPLSVADVSGRTPTGVKFYIARDAAVQFDEVAQDARANDVRLVCVVGKKGADGQVPVRVARCDILDDDDGVVRSLPEADTKDPLAALNRDPRKFNGSPVTVVGVAALLSANPLPQDRFRVLFLNMGLPRSVQFAYAPGIAKKLGELKLKPNGLYRVRLTGSVDAKPDGGIANVSVTKVEILHPTDDSVQKTIE